jgi:hypothetical protein
MVEIHVTGKPTRRVQLDGSGNAATWDDVADGLHGDGFLFPASAPLRMSQEVYDYRAAVRQVAADLLLGVSWAPKAIHDALQEGRPIKLPAPDPGCMVVVPRDTFQSTIAPAMAMFGSTQHRMSAERALALSDALDDIRSLLPSDSGDRLQKERARTWEPARESVASTLRGERITDQAKSARERAKCYLDAAVTGVLAKRQRGS